MQCVEVCPKDVSPMDRIMDLRETAIEIGAKKTHGYDHTNSFEKSVVAHGRLDESRLALESAGIFNLPRLLDLIPVGLRALIKGKLPPLFPHKAKDNKKINEAEYQGRKVKLGKIMQGDVKKFKVYVKNPKGNVVKVNFGQGGDAKGGTMRIRKSNPKARKSFRARHNCDNPGPRHKARYWSCRKW